MQKTESKLTVLFEDPFWIGVYERVSDGELEVCKITFGAEPKDYEVFEFFLHNFNKLRFSPPIKADVTHEAKTNPKRIQREINKLLSFQGVGTKSQHALKLQQEQGKTSRKEKTKEQKEAEDKLKYDLRQQKHREKHKGH